MKGKITQRLSSQTDANSLFTIALNNLERMSHNENFINRLVGVT